MGMVLYGVFESSLASFGAEDKDVNQVLGRLRGKHIAVTKFSKVSVLAHLLHRGTMQKTFFLKQNCFVKETF